MIMKREEPHDLRSKKRKEQLSSNEWVGSTSESATVLKNKNKMVVSCLGRDQNSPLAAGEKLNVVLALYCPQQTKETRVKRRKTLSITLLNNSLDHNLVENRRASFDGEALNNAIITGNVSKVKVQNQKVTINKDLEAAPKPVDEHKEVNMVQQKKRTRVGKRHTDQVNNCLESGRNNVLNTLETNYLDKGMMGNVPAMFDENISSEAVSKTTDEEKGVCVVQKKGKRTRVGKRCTDQGNNQLEIGQSKLSKTLETSNSDQYLMENKSDLPDENKSSEAVSKTADEQKEVCAVQQKEKRKRVGKRRTDQKKECQLEIGRSNQSNTLESSNAGQNLMEKKLDSSDQNKSSEAADEQKEVCAVQQKGKKRKRVGKRCTDQEKKPQLETGGSNLSNTLETSNLEQNLMEKKPEPSDENKRSEAASNTADEQKEVCTVQQKGKRTRVAKRSTDQENTHQLDIGQSNLSNTLETSNSDQNLMEKKLDPSDETKGSGAASKTADEQKEVCAVQQKKKRTTVGKRRNDQGSKYQVKSVPNDLSNTLVESHLGQNLSEEKSDPFDGKILNTSLKAASKDSHKGASSTSREVQDREVTISNSLEAVPPTETADEQGEVCLVPLKKKRKVKRRATLENNDLLESGDICVSDKRKTKRLKLKKSGPEISELSLMRNEAETSLLDVKSLQTYQRKDKKFCSLDNSSNGLKDEQKSNQKYDNEFNVVQQVVPEDIFSEEEKLRLQTNFSDANLEQLKEAKPVSDQVLLNFSTNSNSVTCSVSDHAAGISKRKTKAKVVRSTHQDKDLESHSRYNLCDDQLPCDNEGDLVKVQKTAHECEFLVEETAGDSPADCRKDHNLSLLGTSDPCSDNLRVMSEMGSPLELCKEGCNSTSENGMFLPVDQSSANHPTKKSASRKRRKKDKIRQNSDEVKAFDDLPNLDLSVAQTNSPSGEGITTTSLNECQMEEITPSTGDINIREDKLLKRFSSPERTSIGHTQMKLLILDLNGLLVDIVSVLPKGYTADKRIAKKALLRRPFCDDFLKFCFERFNVGVWSSRTKKNVDSVVDYIMGDMRRKLLFCWDQSHCTKTGFNTVEDVHKPLVFKELKKLWDKHEQESEPKLPWEKGEYNESNTLLLDDSPYKALLNPRHTAIFPCSYDFQNANDDSLGPGGDLRVYLEGLAAAENVQRYIEQNPFGQRAITSRNPSWSYYLKIVNANRFCLPT